MITTTGFSAQEISQLRTELEQYKTVNCRLAHERVVNIESGELSNDIDPEVVAVSRKGFCDKALRNHMLGCAHTKANYTFAHLADAAYAQGLLDTEQQPSMMLNNIIVKIYLMDHEKGAAEKRLAIARELPDAVAADAVGKQIDDIVNRHTAAMAELEALRERIVACVSGYQQQNITL